MPTGAPGLRQRKKQQVRKALFAAALRLFRERGFDGTSVEAIAAEAEVAPRTFFRYFPTKEDVIFLDQAEEDARLAQALRDRQPGESDLDLVMRSLARALIAPIRDPAHLHAVEVLVRETPSLQARSLLLGRRWEELIFEALSRGRRRSRGEQLRVRVLAACVVPVVQAALRAWREAGARNPPEGTVREALELLRRGLDSPG